MRVLAGRDDGPAWDGIWESFERYLRGIGRSPETVSTYRRCAKTFTRWLEAEGLPRDPLQVRRVEMLAFLAYLREERALKPAGVKLHWSTLHRFFGWMVAEEELEVSPMARVPAPVVEDDLPVMLADDQVRAMLAACRGKDFLARRDTALIRFLVDTGARRAELLGIKLEELNLADQSAKVTGKGGRPGTVYFGDKTALDVDRYLRARAKHPRAGDPALWIGTKGQLGNDGLAAMLHKRALQAGLETDLVHPHAFRHAFADRLKRGGASDEDTMALGRWKDPAVMRRYARSTAQERARDTHRRLSPGDRL